MDSAHASRRTTERGPRRSVSRLLVLRSTVTTREIARRYGATLEAAYPARTRDVFLALTTPTAPWPGSGIVWMHHHGTETSLMPFPAASYLPWALKGRLVVR